MASKRIPPNSVKTTERLPSLEARKQQMVRDAIWDAAIDLFVQNGFNETTVGQIAEAAGISRRSFFRYFASKDDLMAEDMLRYARTVTDAIASVPDSYSPLQVVRETLLQVASRAAAGTHTRKIMLIAANNPYAKEAHLSRLSQVQDSVAEAFAKRQARHSKDELIPRVLAGVTMCLFNITFRSWFESDAGDINLIAEQVMSALTHLSREKSSVEKQQPKSLSVAGVKPKRAANPRAAKQA